MSTAVLQGLSIIGQLFSPSVDPADVKNAIELSAQVLAGVHDNALLCAFVFKQTGQAVNADAARTNEGAIAALNVLKSMIRRSIQKVIGLQIKEERSALLDELKKSQKPHAMGTTKEIAQKLGVSISEVRRMKASGALDALNS